MPIGDRELSDVDAVRLRVFVYEHVLARGLPPTCAEIAKHFDTNADSARRALAALEIGKTILVHPDTGEIWMAGPFAASPTPYRVSGARTSWWANCAWDMLGVVAIAGEPVRIDAACTDCGEAMLVEADPETGALGAGIVHFLLPARRWYDDIGFT